MFTLQEIKSAHSKVRSGADFPAYIRELKKMGVTRYETFVSDGHTEYFGNDGSGLSAPAVYGAMTIVRDSDPLQFVADLRAHQQGKSDYPTFCSDCARSGIEKWAVDLSQMSCLYFDLNGREILVEQIPE